MNLLLTGHYVFLFAMLALVIALGWFTVSSNHGD
jgi:hypothetical protein